MISEQVAKSILSIIKDTDKVIDIGGARYPWWRADYILDKRTFEEKVGETAWQGAKEKKERFSKDTWISHDFYELPWPFPDKYFDFSICMGTLEDLRDPIAIAKEIQRVSKAGYISTPTRAWESSLKRGTSEIANNVFGYLHHRWLVEIINDELVFKHKNGLLQTKSHLSIDNPFRTTLHYFWSNNFEIKEEYLASAVDTLNDYKHFYELFISSHFTKMSEIRIPAEFLDKEIQIEDDILKSTNKLPKQNIFKKLLNKL